MMQGLLASIRLVVTNGNCERPAERDWRGPGSQIRLLLDAA